MYTLRRITSNNDESNTSLGDSYNLVLKDRNHEDFKDFLKPYNCVDDGNIYGFIVYNSGQKTIPLYIKSTYFVMTENGKTFANITFR